MPRSPQNEPEGAPPQRAIHVIVLDGTLSSLEPASRTNAGQAYGLLKETRSALSLYYEPGLQWTHWRSIWDVIAGRGINRQIRRAYGWLSARYRPGDRIFLLGYSRGAYAVRSLAGVMNMVGLLRPNHSTKEAVRTAYRHYETNPASAEARAFSAAYCHQGVEIDTIAIWDTVKSLGLNAPVLWRLSRKVHGFHNHELGADVLHGYHALAHDETRVAYAPVLWTTPEGYSGRVEQVWFPGTHGDVGGHLGGFEAARPLANIPLVWMLSKLEARGLPLPPGWQDRFVQDPLAPSQGTFRGYGKLLVTRRRRRIGLDPSERLHVSLHSRSQALGTRLGHHAGPYVQSTS
ncbi:DUF2235 domain-containing protein [Sulfitobacter sp. G21635-S1]|uniref:DUF2235 domain-containing protein n=1 Tax=Sulfitobacter sp. G21635-S1 TaxID=3014043 RepID=UPI0022AFF5F0|nr:DUF2235 domain-containing protein [Sulfitobacter sp. G21635-S1]MCZ4256931.1 DUF2235 domain-containing protein [Sulfitobacter sp. G21635-S1]